MANVDLEVSTVKYSSPILPRVVVVGLAWLVVYTITRLGIQKYRRIIRTNMYIAFVLLVLLFFVCIVARGGVKGLNLIITIDWAHVFYLKVLSFNYDCEYGICSVAGLDKCNR